MVASKSKTLNMCAQCSPVYGSASTQYHKATDFSFRDLGRRKWQWIVIFEPWLSKIQIFEASNGNILMHINISGYKIKLPLLVSVFEQLELSSLFPYPSCTLLCNPFIIQFDGWGRLCALPAITLTGPGNPTLLCKCHSQLISFKAQQKGLFSQKCHNNLWNT